MPLYEYHCQECGRHFERIERPSAMHDGTCPDCGGAAHRLVSAPALQFKGSGWYVTDYGKGNGGSAATRGPESGTPAATTDAGSSSADSPSKPAGSSSKSDTKVA